MIKIMEIDIFYFIVLAICVIFAGGLVVASITEGLRKRKRR